MFEKLKKLIWRAEDPGTEDNRTIRETDPAACCALPSWRRTPVTCVADACRDWYNT